MPRFLAGLVLAIGVLSLGGCEDRVGPVCLQCGGSSYVEPTSPENVLHNLVEAYRRKEIEPYARILAPEFVFKFQPVDVQELGIDPWNKDQDVAGTGALFGTPLVGDIRITLIYGPAEPPIEEGFAEGTLKIRILPTQLEVDQIAGDEAGITNPVDGDMQDMFFRQGKAELGENPDHWFLFEWQDLPDPYGAPETAVPPASGRVAAGKVTWGRIKTLFG